MQQRELGAEGRRLRDTWLLVTWLLGARSVDVLGLPPLGRWLDAAIGHVVISATVLAQHWAGLADMFLEVAGLTTTLPCAVFRDKATPLGTAARLVRV